MTLNFKPADLDSITLTQNANYLGQMSFNLKVNHHIYTCIHSRQLLNLDHKSGN